MFVQDTDDRLVPLLQHFSSCGFSPKRIAALTGRPITREKLQIPRRRRRRTDSPQQRLCGPDPPPTYTEPNQSPGGRKASDTAWTLKTSVCHKSHEPEDSSACSDLESGVADLSSRSSCGGEDRKDADSD